MATTSSPSSATSALPRDVFAVRLIGATAHVIAERQITVIDAGLFGSWPLLRRGIRRIGRDPSEITRVLVTHEHPDHAGAAGAIARATGARVLAYPRLRDGAVLPALGGLEVIHTPGHTAGSVSFYAPRERLLFCGDALWCDGDRLHPPNRFFSQDLAEARRSIEKVATRDVGTIAFGHLAPYHGDVAAAFRNLLVRWTRPTY